MSNHSSARNTKTESSKRPSTARGSTSKIEGDQTLKAKLEDQELAFIRKNVTLERIELAERIMREQAIPRRADDSSRHMSDLESYFSNGLMESVYRAHKGSFKIVYSKDRAEIFLATILYVLFGEPESDPAFLDLDKLEQRILAVLKKRFPKTSYFSKYAHRYLATKTGEENKKAHWMDIGSYFFTLGGEIFYYCTLQALIEICREALTDKSFNFRGIITWQQGIAVYLIAEAL